MKTNIVNVNRVDGNNRIKMENVHRLHKRINEKCAKDTWNNSVKFYIH